MLFGDYILERIKNSYLRALNVLKMELELGVAGKWILLSEVTRIDLFNLLSVGVVI